MTAAVSNKQEQILSKRKEPIPSGICWRKAVENSVQGGFTLNLRPNGDQDKFHGHGEDNAWNQPSVH
jgi:hypothetical protein